MAKERTVEYYQTLFMGTGTEFDIKKLYKAAKEADDLHDFPKRSDAAYQVWASKILRRLEGTPLVTITRAGKSYKTIQVHDANGAALLLGKGSEDNKTPVSEPKKETPTEITEAVIAYTMEDKFVISCKALRFAVRTSNGGIEAKIKPEDLMEACLHKERFPEIAEIIQALSDINLDIQLPVVKEEEKRIIFTNHVSDLKKVCDRGTELYPSRWKNLFNFKFACDKAYDAALETLRKEKRGEIKPATKTSAIEVFTDDDNFRVFIMGGYLMDKMKESHENASIRELGTVLEKRGRSLSTLRLESLINSVPEFYVDGTEVYLKLKDKDDKDFWDKFRKKYWPLSGEKEQIICNLRMSLEEISEKLSGSQVKLVDKHPDGFNTFRVDLPKNSVVAKYNFADFMNCLRKGEQIYTDSKFVDSLWSLKKKRDSSLKIQDDLYRYEIGYFGKKRV